LKPRTLALLVLGAFALAACTPKPKVVKKPAAARPAADKAKVEAFYIEGVYAYAEGDTAKAMAAWKKALALDPKHAPTLKAMAEAKAKVEAVKKLDK
jgi:Tfp pilus assembly protein PilF